MSRLPDELEPRPNERRTASEDRSSSTTSTPVGLVIVALLVGLGGFVDGLVGLVLLELSVLFGLFGLAIAAVQLYLAFGLLDRRAWAYTWTLVVEGLGCVIALLAGNVPGAVVSVLVLGYLLASDLDWR